MPTLKTFGLQLLEATIADIIWDNGCGYLVKYIGERGYCNPYRLNCSPFCSEQKCFFPLFLEILSFYPLFLLPANTTSKSKILRYFCISIADKYLEKPFYLFIILWCVLFAVSSV